MNFLQLCQRAASEAGVSSSGPASVLNQQGLLRRIVSWVADAYQELQLSQDWRFLWRRDTGLLQAGKSTYTAAELGIPTLGRIYSRRFFLTASGTALYFTPYETLVDAAPSSGSPLRFSRLPDDTIMVWPTPDADTQVTIEHLRSPHVLAADADAPIIPLEPLHVLVAWQAVEKYATAVGDTDALASARGAIPSLWAKLSSAYAPDIDARPVALDYEPEAAPVLV